MDYRIAEKFTSVQGEGLYAGTPMAFIRFVGCSVGKKICNFCDTDFESELPWRGGGVFTEGELMQWAGEYDHVCFTGGEPLNQDLWPFFRIAQPRRMFHIETSGTIMLPDRLMSNVPPGKLWLCVSPKPGYLMKMIDIAHEIKVIVPGLGPEGRRCDACGGRGIVAVDIRKATDNDTVMIDVACTRCGGRGQISNGWPTLKDALTWSSQGKLVYLQPRNAKNDVDRQNLLYCQDLIREHPQLRLSVQLHKILKVQ